MDQIKASNQGGELKAPLRNIIIKETCTYKNSSLKPQRELIDLLSQNLKKLTNQKKIKSNMTKQVIVRVE